MLHFTCRAPHFPHSAPVSPDPSFLEQLKSRKVVRVGLVYLATAFAAIEVADIAVEPLGLPEWTITFLFVIAAVFFPVALALAWAFDVTPEGVRRVGPSFAAGQGASRWISGGALLTVGALVTLGGTIGWWAGGGLGGDADELDGAGAGAAVDGPASIAVLPFADMSAGGDMVYFGDGMAEEILNVLAGNPELEVVGRTSSFSFRDSDRDLGEIGRALGVETILEGSIRRSGDRIRVTAQLIRTSDQIHLWSETYDRTFSEDVFAVQDDIARQISERLRGELRGGGRAVGGTGSLAAYDRFLKGREAWATRNEEGIVEAIDHFQAALELDPEYAEAWAALAEAYAVGYGNGLLLDYDRTVVPAREAVHRALELAPDLAVAHRARGLVLLDASTDAGPIPFEEVERSFRRALELNPSDPWARFWLSQTLQMTGRRAEAREEARRAAELDPLALQIRAGVAQHHLVGGDFDRARAEIARILAIDPTFLTAIFVSELARALAAGEPAVFDSMAAHDETDPYSGSVRAIGLAGLGKDEEARSTLDRIELHPSRWDALFRARAWELIGDVDRAFEELGRIRLLHQGYMILGWPAGPVRADPRFDGVLARVGLERAP